MKYIFLILMALPFCIRATDGRPNIVWIFTEDMNDWMGCYGDNTVPTPNIDALAARGMLFERAYMPAGVCSATRSAIAMGTMQTSLGIHNHRSSRQRVTGEETKLPKKYRTVYQLLRDNGYYVVNDGRKSDFNFIWPIEKGTEGTAKQMKRFQTGYGTGAVITEDKSEILYDVNTEAWPKFKSVWSTMPKDKPLFLQIQLKGGKNHGNYAGVKALSRKSSKTHTDQSKIRVMPYYPDLPSIRKEIAHHYDNVRLTDNEIGSIIAKLKKDGLYENTIFFFWTDHGMKLYRHKQWLYEGGIRVPMIMAGPGIGEGVVRSDLVSGIDITATTLALSQTAIPTWMEGKNLLAKDYKREYVVSARDRCDYTIARSRAITTQGFKYIRNFKTDRSFMQPQYRDGDDVNIDAHAHYTAGKMTEQQAILFAPNHVAEELYDLNKDQHEVNNLAKDPEYASTLREHQLILTKWIQETDDKGQYDETISSLKGVLSQWGETAVNPEFDKARK
ncbi:sulfatase [Lentisphaera profundi]|uniref:Sulfatase n=1 Tax=Lentisphaera profundi TaxID=1658616 RepID=A0ABY7VQP4_9BACT|nr:sulfatase [Lentisphaera profundi]WDE96510.1 sulfatase [Lentisphaera profundi]